MRLALLVSLALSGCSASFSADAEPGGDSGAVGSADGGDGTDGGDGGGADGGDGTDGGDGSDGSDGSDGGDGADGGDGTEEPAPDLSESGPHAVSTESLSESVGSCTMAVTRYTPSGSTPVARVILAHGFSRTAANMAGWGAHLATWGVEALVPDLCHSAIWDTDHEQNGLDMVGLNVAVGGGPVVYAGYSAGGLAATVAAATDTHAIGLVGIDLVDAGDVAVSFAGDVTAPIWGVLGDSGFCNTNNNGLAVYAAAPSAIVARLHGADHCDFESPTDWVCELGCPDAGTSLDTLHPALAGLIAGAALGAAGDVAAADAWWRPGGVYFDAMAAAGTLSAE